MTMRLQIRSYPLQARELHSAMEGMRSAAMNLPGGHLSVEEIRRLESLLEAEGDKRR